MTTVCTIVCVSTSLAGSPARAQQQAPELSAAAAILVDARDGTVIAGKRPDDRRSIASTTKLMTALLTLEEVRPAQVFRAPPYDALAAESKIGLVEGERMRVDDLLEALLLESANDAAVTLAEGVGGSRPEFVNRMNERARELGLTNTGYANPVGLDAPGAFSSARDLATLTRRLMRDPRFASVVRQPSATLESGLRRRVIGNRNRLIGRYDIIDGVKTGHTLSAGYVLVGSARGRLGSRVISVVLGEPSEAGRDADTLALLRFGLSRFRRVKALDDDKPVASAPIAHRDRRARLRPARDALLVVRRGERLRTRVDAPAELEGELAAGTPVGTVAVVSGGRVVRTVPLVTAAEVPAPGSLRLIAAELPTIVLAVLALLVVLGLGSLAARERDRRRAIARDEWRCERDRARADVG